MALFGRRKPTPAPESTVERASFPASLYEALGASAGLPWPTGPVTAESALRSAASWACIMRIKQTVTSLPIDVIAVEDGKRRPIPTLGHPALIKRPSAIMSRRNWVGSVLHQLLVYGNAYGVVVDVDAGGLPTMIEPIDPATVSWMDGRPYILGQRRHLLGEGGDLWHVPVSHLMTGAEPYAISPVHYASNTVGLNLAAEKFGMDFFRGGGVPVAILWSDQPHTTVQADQAKRAIMTATANRGIAALGSGWKLDPFNVNPSDTQFIDLLQATVLDACRRWLVPPSMVYAAITGKDVTYANVSENDLQYLKHGVTAWLQDLEDSLTDMVSPGLTVRFNVDAVLRMDKKARSEEHKLRLETKTRTVNEVRLLEDEEPFDDPKFDEPGIPTDPPAEPPPGAEGGGEEPPFPEAGRSEARHLQGKHDQASHGRGPGGIADRINRKGGATVHMHPYYTPTSGFMVSRYPEREKIFTGPNGGEANVTAAQVMEFAEANDDLLSRPDHFFGGWKTDDKKQVFLDVSVKATVPTEAASLCSKHNQYSFFDLATLTTYNHDGTKQGPGPDLGLKWDIVRSAGWFGTVVRHPGHPDQQVHAGGRGAALSGTQLWKVPAGELPEDKRALLGEAKALHIYTTPAGDRMEDWTGGTGLSPEVLREVFDTQRQLSSSYGMKDPVLVKVWGKNMPADAPARVNEFAAWVREDERTVNYKAESLARMKDYYPKAEPAELAGIMPTRAKDPIAFVVAHEFGHLHDFAHNGGSTKGVSKGHAATRRALGSDGMSEYGKTNIMESYAEAFAEWHVSKGATSNQLVRDYATLYEWRA